MLRDEVARYTELSGNDGLHTPIGIIGAYLDGYEKGRTDAQPKLDENTLSEQQESDKLGVKTGETCTDCISRQAAIDKIREVYEYEFPTASGAFDEFVTVIIPNLLRNLPPAQPDVPDANVGDMINRQDVLALAKDVILINGAKHRCIDATQIHELPSAQPEYHLDEWCTDCKEYDHERHCCPRWNRVIRTTLQDAQRTGRWIEDSGNIACSECHIIWLHRRTAFCPNCGADMRGEQDE